MKSVTLKLLVGGLAGLLVWVGLEPFAPRDALSPEWGPYSLRVVTFLGLAIGLCLGGFSGWQQGSKLHLIRSAVLGACLGAAGGLIGAGLGDRIGNAIFGQSLVNVSIVISALRRVIELTPVGGLIGFAVGISSLNLRRGVQGLVGGLIGGAIGAAVFDVVGDVFAGVIMASRGVDQNGVVEVGTLSRAIFYIVLGAAIGLFIGLVELVARVAWLRLAVGRNEGREWVLDGLQTFIGRSETAQVPLFGDTAVAPVHACISRQGPNYILADWGSQSGTFLNGYPVTQAPLFHGAVIRIGGYQLEFLMRVGSAPQKAAEALRSQQAYALQGQAQVSVPMVGPAIPMPMSPQPSAPAPTAAVPITAPNQPPPGAQLVAMSGPLSGNRFPISAGLEVGREASGIPLTFDSSASRRHASFTPSQGGIVLTDLGSTNGTFVNDVKVQAAILAKGDLVRIGVTTFRVE